jgi:glucokinase
MKALWRQRDIPRVEAFWEQMLDNLARGIASLYHVLDMEAVILGGGLSRGEGFLSALTPKVLRYLGEPYRKLLDIRLSKLGNDAPVVGAAAQAAQRLGETRA